MRIAFIVTDLSNERIGGISRVATEVGAGLVKLGHQVTAYVLDRRSGRRCESYKGITLRYIHPFPSLNPDYPVMGFSRRAFRKCLDDAKKHPFDIIQSFNLNGIAYPSFQKEIDALGIPFVMASFETIAMDVKAKMDEFRGLVSGKTLMQILFETYLMLAHEKRYLGRADMIVTEDQNTKNALVAMGISADLIRLAPSGVDIAHAQAVEPPKADFRDGMKGPILGYIGRVDPRKGIQFLLEALAEVKRSFPEIVLFLAGGSRHGYDRKIKELISRLRLDANVKVLGRIEGDIQGYYKCADLVVIPSLSEGIPITLGEAIAVRVPVVITKLPGVVPFVQPSDLVEWAEIGNSKSLAAAILRGLEDSNREDRVERAYEFIKHYSWLAVAERYAEIYAEIILEKEASQSKRKDFTKVLNAVPHTEPDPHDRL